LPLIARPQPLGVLPLPAGWLVWPVDALRDPAVAQARDGLLTGRLPEPWPAGVRAHELAAAGDATRAAESVDPGAGPEHAYNHVLLTGDETSLALARRDASGDLAALVEVAAYALGHADDLPPTDGLDGEVLAHVLAARAAAALEAGDPQAALDALVTAEEAVRPVSPVLAAMVLGQQATLAHHVNGADPGVVTAYREASEALRGLDAVEQAAGEITLGLATAYHELAAGGAQGLLLEATRTYHLALRLLHRERHPERYAFAHSNLALAYLAMPMTEAKDGLRRGVAVQSLREALAYYTREDHPREWASVTLNLANAMQHLPSTHPVDNLVEAVDLYDQLLEVRTRDADPVGRARVLANQGTALAHLGIHDQARLRLAEAREIFDGAGDAAAVATVDEAVREIEETVRASA
jgi:tetratricopeptide (TPR) repeat protein